MKLLVLSALVLVATIHATSGFRIFNPWWPHQPSWHPPCRNVTDDGSQQSGDNVPWWWRFIPQPPPCRQPSSNSTDSADEPGHWDSHQGNNSWSDSWSNNSSSSSDGNRTDTY
nr:uncharacterized protein LOC109397129 [Aedes albopictus]